MRLPKTGQRCTITGLSRATLNELILGTQPPVKSVVLRKRGNTRGIRLIECQSLLAHLHGLETIISEKSPSESIVTIYE